MSEQNLTEIRDKLLKESNQEPEENRKAYRDGILDMYNLAMREGNKHALPLPS